jgi:dTDP-4-dehydrorhamnose reductase
MPPTVLVTGATGLLGREVMEAFSRAGWVTVGQGYSRAAPPKILKANLENINEIEKLLDEAKPTPQVVVHCAANRSPDQCDKNPEQARKLNVEATRALAQATSSRSILFIYISTDYVFPGTEGEAPYEASSSTKPTNLYGEMKRDGEIVTLEATHDSGLGVILRVPVLYGPTKNNSESAVNVLLDMVYKAQDPNSGIKMDDWAQRYPTNTEDVARVCKDIAEKYLQEKDQISSLPRILQFSSEDQMTKYEICEKLAQILGVPLPGMVRNKQGNDPNATVQRPFNTKLSTKELRELGIDVWTQDFIAWWRRQLGAYRK